MAKEYVELIVGDWSGDGHGKHDSIPMIVEFNDDSATKALKEAEETITKQFDIDLSTWFSDYEDNKINKKDTQKLIDLGININKQDIDNGELTVWLAEDFFEIWKQLIVKVNPKINIEKFIFTSFDSKCSGYGLYE